MPHQPVHEQLHALAEQSKQGVAAPHWPGYHVGAASCSPWTRSWGDRLGGCASLPCSLDATITRALQHHSVPWLQAVMDVMSYLGSSVLLWLPCENRGTLGGHPSSGCA